MKRKESCLFPWGYLRMRDKIIDKDQLYEDVDKLL